MVESSKGLKPWRAAIAACAPRLPALLDGPLDVQLQFCFPRPKKHYRTGKSAHLLRPDAPRWHTSKPDADKLERAVLDSLTAVIYRDDAQVALLHAAKVWCTGDEMPGVVVTVREIDSQEEP